MHHKLDEIIINMEKSEVEKEKVGSLIISKELLNRIKIRAVIEGTTIKELTERILSEACPPASSWTVKK